MNSNPSTVLQRLGWNDHFASAFAALDHSSLEPARLAADHGSRFVIESVGGPATALLSKALRDDGPRPVVGDWLAVSARIGTIQIQSVLPRQTAIARKAPDATVEEQILAANVDLVFIASAVDSDFNLRRIERLLTVAYQSGAAPVIVLTKSDLDDPAPLETQLLPIAAGVPVLCVSALRDEGVDAVRRCLPPGKTAVVVGSSGVGKSTLINRLLGIALLRTAETHAGGQGRHTTTHRQLITVPDAGLIIDTPGLREIQLWAGEAALGDVFGDIERLAGECRFNDCAHDNEPECAVQAALQAGSLDQARFRSYRKLQRELRSIEVRADARLRIEERQKWKAIHRAATDRMKAKRRLP